MMTFPWDKTLSIPVADIGLCMFERYEDARYHRFHPVYFEAGARNPLATIRADSITEAGYTFFPLNAIGDGMETFAIRGATKRAFVSSNRDDRDLHHGRYSITRQSGQSGIVLDGLTDCVFDGLSFMGSDDFAGDTGGIVIRNCKRLFFRDCWARRFRVGWSIENSEDIFIQHALTTECLLRDPAHHAQGLWMRNSSVTMWDSAFIDCGSSETHAIPNSKFRHSCYCSEGSVIDFRGCITIDSSSHGVQARGPRSVIRDHISLGDAVGIEVGNDDPKSVDGVQVRPVPGGVVSRIENAYCQGARDIVTATTSTPVAWGFKARNIKEGHWRRLCVVDHASKGSARGLIIDGATNAGSCGVKGLDVDQVYSRNGGRLQVIPGVLQNVKVSKADFPRWPIGPNQTALYEVMPGPGDNKIDFTASAYGARFIRPLDKAAIREALLTRPRGVSTNATDAAVLITQAMEWGAP